MILPPIGDWMMLMRWEGFVWLPHPSSICSQSARQRRSQPQLYELRSQPHGKGLQLSEHHRQLSFLPVFYRGFFLLHFVLSPSCAIQRGNLSLSQSFKKRITLYLKYQAIWYTSFRFSNKKSFQISFPPQKTYYQL